MCDKTCIFFFFPIINKYFLMAKRSLLSRCPSYISTLNTKHPITMLYEELIDSSFTDLQSIAITLGLLTTKKVVTFSGPISFISTCYIVKKT